MAKLDIGFIHASTNGDATWDLMIDESRLSERSIQEIKTQLQLAFEAGMSFKARQLRECLEVKENVHIYSHWLKQQ